MQSTQPPKPQKIPIHFQSIVQPGKKYQCISCKKDTSTFTFILAPNGIYCIPCFARLKKWPGTYQVINKLEFPVLDQQWPAIQEIYMFQGFEKHGFGNWNQIADYMEANKTKEDVEKHYTEFYLNSPNFIPSEQKLLSRRHSSTQKQKSRKQNPNRQTVTSKRLQSLSLQKSQSKSSLQPVQIVGYMPLRNDYQFQYDNEAELLLAEMQFTDQDTEQQKQMKFKIIELYNRKLTERNKKKQFVLSRGILDLQKHVQAQKNLTKPQKQIYNMMKIFSRYQTAGDHEQLVKGIIKQKQLRQKIQQYKQLHRRGFRTKIQIQQQIQRKNQSKIKKKSSAEYNSFTIPDARTIRRNNQQMSSAANGNLQAQSKKQSPYFSTPQLQLLKSLKLSSISFMMMKQTILREYQKEGVVNREQVYSMFNLDRFIVERVVDYLQGNQDIVCAN